MKKTTIVLLIIFIVWIGIASLSNLGSTVGVALQTTPTSKFSNQDIGQAMDAVKLYFKYNFKGCELLELAYDEASSNEHLVMKGYDASNPNVLFLVSTFYAEKTGTNPAIMADSTYTNYSWMLTRQDQDDLWQVVGCGEY